MLQLYHKRSTVVNVIKSKGFPYGLMSVSGGGGIGAASTTTSTSFSISSSSSVIGSTLMLTEKKSKTNL